MGTMQCGKDISCQPADFYAHRFLNFIGKILIPPKLPKLPETILSPLGGGGTSAVKSLEDAVETVAAQRSLEVELTAVAGEKWVEEASGEVDADEVDTDEIKLELD